MDSVCKALRSPCRRLFFGGAAGAVAVVAAVSANPFKALYTHHHPGIVLEAPQPSYTPLPFTLHMHSPAYTPTNHNPTHPPTQPTQQHPPTNPAPTTQQPTHHDTVVAVRHVCRVKEVLQQDII